MRTEHIELAVHLARMNPTRRAHLISDDVRKLKRVAARAQTIAVTLCNESHYSTAQADKDTVPIARKAISILNEYGLQCEFSRDPRGYCFRIMGIDGNGWEPAEGFGL